MHSKNSLKKKLAKVSEIIFCKKFLDKHLDGEIPREIFRWTLWGILCWLFSIIFEAMTVVNPGWLLEKIWQWLKEYLKNRRSSPWGNSCKVFGEKPSDFCQTWGAEWQNYNFRFVAVESLKELSSIFWETIYKSRRNLCENGWKNNQKKLRFYSEEFF